MQTIYYIDREESVEIAEGAFYRLHRARRRGMSVERASKGKWVTIDPDQDFVYQSALPPEVLEWSPGQLLMPADIADFGNLPVMSWRDLPEETTARPRRRGSQSAHAAGPSSAAPWKLNNWASPAETRSSSAKEALLLKSLEIARRASQNGNALETIVEKAVVSGLFGIATRAVLAIGQTDWEHFYSAASALLREPGAWTAVGRDFVDACEARARSGPAQRWNVGFGDPVHFPDGRSVCLARVGEYHYFQGATQRAAKAWELAGDRVDVDEVIEEMCDLIAEHEPDSLPRAIELTEMIHKPRIRARALASLSSYL